MKLITPKQIKDDLETAAYVERLLPPVKPPKYRAWLFDIVYTQQELAFMDRRPVPPRPTQEQISIWDKVVLKWLPLLVPLERNLVWKRAKHLTWKLLSREYGLHRSNLYFRYEIAIMKIYAGINPKFKINKKMSRQNLSRQIRKNVL